MYKGRKDKHIGRKVHLELDAEAVAAIEEHSGWREK